MSAPRVDTERLKALLAAATPGPWHWTQHDARSAFPGLVIGTMRGANGCACVFGMASMTLADAELIEVAINALPALLAELETLRAEIVALKIPAEGMKREPLDDYPTLAQQVCRAVHGGPAWTETCGQHALLRDAALAEHTRYVLANAGWKHAQAEHDLLCEALDALARTRER